MKTVAIFALVIFVSLVSQSALAGEQLWDFEDGGQINDWEIINGTWEINDGVLQETSGAESGMHAYVGDAGWENYTIEADMRIDEGKYAGIVFRGQADYEYYVFYLELTPAPNDLCFFKHKPGGSGARDRPSPNKTGVGGRADLVHGEWINFRAVVEGNDFQLFLNDQETVPAATDNLGNEYTVGKAGVFAWETKVSFDNFKVYGPDIEGAAVDSRDKLETTWGRLKQD
jgi:hypothetical protein